MAMKQKLRKIAVELYDIHNRNVGLGEFTWQFAEHLAARAERLRAEHGVVFYFIVPFGYEGCFGKAVRYIPLSDVTRYLVRYWPVRMDLCHLTHQYSRIKFMRFARRNLLTIHDINFMYEKEDEKLDKYCARFRRRLDVVDALSYISEFARKDVERHFAPDYPARIIYNGVADLSLDRRGGASDAPRTAEGRQLPEGYLLHLSSLWPKKNAHLLIEMMRYLPEEHLVLVGNWQTRYGERLKQRIAEAGIGNVTALDHVSDAEKAELFAHCRGFLFPSLCEGFGLPPVEAMYFGKPVFLSTLTSLPEIGGPEAFYYDDLNPEAMAGVTRRGLADFYADAENRAARTRAWARQFDWDKCTDEYVAYYLDLLDGQV